MTCPPTRHLWLKTKLVDTPLPTTSQNPTPPRTDIPIETPIEIPSLSLAKLPARHSLPQRNQTPGSGYPTPYQTSRTPNLIPLHLQRPSQTRMHGIHVRNPFIHWQLSLPSHTQPQEIRRQGSCPKIRHPAAVIHVCPLVRHPLHTREGLRPEVLASKRRACIANASHLSSQYSLQGPLMFEIRRGLLICATKASRASAVVKTGSLLAKRIRSAIKVRIWGR